MSGVCVLKRMNSGSPNEAQSRTRMPRRSMVSRVTAPSPTRTRKKCVDVGGGDVATRFGTAQALMRHRSCPLDRLGVFAVGRPDDQCLVAFPQERQCGQPDQLAGTIAGEDLVCSNAQPIGQGLAQHQCMRVGVAMRRDAAKNLSQASRRLEKRIEIGAEVKNRVWVEAKAGQLREVRAAVNGLRGDPLGTGLWWSRSHWVWQVQHRRVNASRARPVVAATSRVALPISAAHASARPPPIR